MGWVPASLLQVAASSARFMPPTNTQPFATSGVDRSHPAGLIGKFPKSGKRSILEIGNATTFHQYRQPKISEMYNLVGKPAIFSLFDATLPNAVPPLENSRFGRLLQSDARVL